MLGAGGGEAKKGVGVMRAESSGGGLSWPERVEIVFSGGVGVSTGVRGWPEVEVGVTEEPGVVEVGVRLVVAEIEVYFK